MEFNKVEITSDIDLLENSFKGFTRQSKDKRIASDDYLIRTIGCNNYDLYRRLKYMINRGLITESVDVDDINTSWNESSQFNDIPVEEYKQKLQMTQNYNMSSNRVIIPPIHYSNKYDIHTLEDMYSRYNSLSQDFKNLSDSISLSIWGYTVRDIYSMMLDCIHNTKEFKPDYTNMVVGECLANRDILGLELCKQYGYIEESELAPTFTMNIKHELPDTLPYFTSDEFTNSIDIDKIEELISKHSFYSTVKKLQKEYKDNPTIENENAVLELGWNPNVEVTKKSMGYVKDRYAKWFNNHSPIIIDLHKNINLSEYSNVLTESSNMMKKLYAEKDMYPVYIVLSYVGGWFAAVQRAVRKVHYCHAGLALDSNLKSIYTFAKWKIKGESMDGFGVESLDDYIDMNKYALVDVLCIFVDGKTMDKLKETVKYFMDNKKKSKYNIPNILNILFRRKVDYGPDNVSMVCSQFTDTVLKSVNIDLTKKPSNLVEPEDFEVVMKHPKVYRVFDGYATRYNEKRAEAYTRILFKKGIRDDILVTNNDLKLDESSIINEMLTPDIVIRESKFPISFNSRGDLSIKQYKTMEEQYQESHKILTSYTKTNLDGIKYELAKLFYLNTCLEKKIKHMKSNEANYKKAVDLRARILNDFKKYFKIVSQRDATFDFGSYFENSEFGGYTIDNSIISNAGKLFVKMIAGI